MLQNTSTQNKLHIHNQQNYANCLQLNNTDLCLCTVVLDILKYTFANSSCCYYSQCFTKDSYPAKVQYPNVKEKSKLHRKLINYTIY